MNRRFVWAIGILCAVFAAGTVGYMVIEGWSAFDSLYMTIITVGTVGFGETHPLSVPGRAFTMVLILAGVGALGYSLAQFIDFLLEGLYSLKKISRSEDRGYQAADTPRRSSGRSSEPLFDQGVPVPGKKKYYN